MDMKIKRLRDSHYWHKVKHLSVAPVVGNQLKKFQPFSPKRDIAQTAPMPPASLNFAFRNTQQLVRMSFRFCPASGFSGAALAGAGSGQFRPGATYKES